MTFDPIKDEHEYVRKHFNIDEVVEFEKNHRVEIILGSDLQYWCFIDKGVYSTGLTTLYALITGIKIYQNELNDKEA